MSIALDLFGSKDLVNIPNAVVLSISNGVGGWGWPNSIRVIRIGIPSRAFTYAAAISASDAALITFLKMLASTCTGALIKTRYGAIGFVGSYLFPRKWYPPTRLLALGMERYDESEEIHKIMSDFLYVIEGLGWVAM